MKIDWAYWLTIITFIIALLLTIWFLLGKSPTFEQLTIGWLSFLSSWLLHINKRFTRVEQRLHDKLTELERRLSDKIDQLKK